MNIKKLLSHAPYLAAICAILTFFGWTADKIMSTVWVKEALKWSVWVGFFYYSIYNFHLTQKKMDAEEKRKKIEEKQKQKEKEEKEIFKINVEKEIEFIKQELKNKLNISPNNAGIPVPLNIKNSSGIVAPNVGGNLGSIQNIILADGKIAQPKINKNDYRWIDKYGIYQHKETGIYYCASCMSNDIASPLQTSEYDWICNVKECGKVYENPDNPDTTPFGIGDSKFRRTLDRYTNSD